MLQLHQLDQQAQVDQGRRLVLDLVVVLMPEVAAGVDLKMEIHTLAVQQDLGVAVLVNAQEAQLTAIPVRQTLVEVVVQVEY